MILEKRKSSRKDSESRKNSQRRRKIDPIKINTFRANKMAKTKTPLAGKRYVKVRNGWVLLGAPIWLYDWFCGFGKLANQLISQLILDYTGNEPTRRYTDV